MIVLLLAILKMEIKQEFQLDDKHKYTELFNMIQNFHKP